MLNPGRTVPVRRTGWSRRWMGALMEKSARAVEQFKSGLNCSQAVFEQYAEAYDVDSEQALKIACGFGGGMGRMGHTCGAVTGAIMAIGMATCRPDPRALAAKLHTYEMVQRFLEQFAARHESTLCRELLGCDINTPEGYAEATRLGLFQTRCHKLVQDAVEILEDML
jgi:C_GCAxxG_C_C family probable redox protein